MFYILINLINFLFIFNIVSTNSKNPSRIAIDKQDFYVKIYIG